MLLRSSFCTRRFGWGASLCLALIVPALTGCEDALEANANDPAPDTEKVKTLRNGAVFSARVDATDEALWIGYDLDGAGEADAATASLLFQRSVARLGRGVEAVAVDIAFDALTEAPAEGWAFEPEATEEPVGRERAEGPLANWFDYDPVHHTLSPADVRYAIRTAEGGCFKVQFTAWYDDAGTSAMFGFDWAPLAGCR